MTAGRPYYKLSEAKVLRPFLSNPLVALGIGWCFQGLLIMDRTERLFKLSLDMALTVLVALPLTMIFHVRWALASIVGFITAHSINLLFNGQIWVLLKHFKCKIVRHSRDEFNRYIDDLERRIGNESSIFWAAAFGSLVRGQWNEYSDLDVRLIRKPGVWNGLCACWFVMKERSRALVRRFPLDIYVLDSFSGLAELRQDESPMRLR
jgi:predicted nucleotidyltransferase